MAERFRRVFLPLLLGLVTVVPAVNWVVGKAIESGSWQTPGGQTASGEGVNQQDPESGLTPLSLAVISDHTETISRLLLDGADASAPNRDGSTPLAMATLLGRTTAAGVLIEAGANINSRAADGSTPLHTAAFFGRADSVELLAREGADIAARNSYGQTPLEVIATDWKTTEYIAALVHVEVDRAQVEAGRSRAAEILRQHGGEGGSGGNRNGVGAMLRALMFTPVFHHLWFLWFLCWLVAGFAVYAALADWCGWRGLRGRLILSPARLLWLLPLTLAAVLQRPISALLQVTYAWVMTFGLMGLFRRFLTRPNHAIRYISDSSYWLYLAHVPLIIGAQMLVRNWPMPATVKFTLVCGVVTAFLLIIYATLVRYTWLGRLLNGPRERPEKAQPAGAPA